MNRRQAIAALALAPILGCRKRGKDLIGLWIYYPYYGGGDRPMVFAVHRIVEVNENMVRVDRPGDRQAWVRINADVVILEPMR